MDIVYSDQIWNKSQCRKFENITYRLLGPATERCGAKIVMVDAVPGAVKHLRQVGFDVIDYIIDHDYDNIVDSVSRQTDILNILEACRDLDINSQLALRMTQSCQHNYNLLETLRQRIPKKIRNSLNFLKVDNQ